MLPAIGAAIVAIGLFVACLVYGHPQEWGIIPNISFDRSEHHDNECDAKEGQSCVLRAVDNTPTPVPTATPVPTPTPVPLPTSGEAKDATPWKFQIPEGKIGIFHGDSVDGFFGDEKVKETEGFVYALGAEQWVNASFADAKYQLVNPDEGKAAWWAAITEETQEGRDLAGQLKPLEPSWLELN